MNESREIGENEIHILIVGYNICDKECVRGEFWNDPFNEIPTHWRLRSPEFNVAKHFNAHL